MKPTRLYIKEHIKTGLRYFGKTVTNDIEKYYGSGKYWKRHIEKHGVDSIITVWVSEWFYDKEEINDFALAFSELFNITLSEQWANLKPENGNDGGFWLYGDDNPAKRKEVRDKISKSLMGHRGVTNKGFSGRTHSEEARKKISESHKVPKSEETKKKMSEAAKLRWSKR